MGFAGLIALIFFTTAACLAGIFMRPKFRPAFAFGAVVGGAICWALTHVFFAGGVVVHDPTGTLRSAMIVSGGGSHELRRVARFYYGEPDRDASLHLTFADGHSEDRCYLTGGAPVWVEIGQPPTC